MLDLHCGQPPAFVADKAGETDHGPGPADPCREGGQLGPRVEGRDLDRDTHGSASGHRREKGHLADAGKRGVEIRKLLIQGNPQRRQVGKAAA